MRSMLELHQPAGSRLRICNWTRFEAQFSRGMLDFPVHSGENAPAVTRLNALRVPMTRYKESCDVFFSL